MDSFFRDPVTEFVKSLFGQSDVAAPLLPLITLYNVALAAIGGLLMFYFISVAVMKTASDGKSAMTNIGVVRALIAATLFIPLPSGVTAGQQAFGYALLEGLSGAKKLYAAADNLVRKEGKPLVMQSDPQAASLALDMAAFLVCASHFADFYSVKIAEGDAEGNIFIKRVVSDAHVTYTHYFDVADTRRDAVCGNVRVVKTGDSVSHEAAFAARVKAIDALLKSVPPLLAGRFVKDWYSIGYEQKKAARDALVAAIADVQDRAFATLIHAHSEQIAAAHSASAAKAPAWDGAFWSIGADIVKLHRAQHDILRASLPGSVEVEPADLRVSHANIFGTFNDREFAYLESQVLKKSGKPLFNTDDEARAVGRQTATRWLNSASKIAFGNYAKARDGIEQVASDVNDVILLSAKKLFIAALQQPGAEIVASPFVALSNIGVPLAMAGKYLAVGGAAGSMIPGLGNVGNSVAVGGAALWFLGSTLEYGAPLIPAILWSGVVLTVIAGALIALVVIPVIGLMHLRLDGEELFVSRGEMWKPVIYFCAFPAVATFGLLSFTVVLGAGLAASNWLFAQAVFNEQSVKSGDAVAWLFYTAFYVVFVIFSASYTMFKLTFSLADKVASTLAVAMPFSSSDESSKVLAGGIVSSKTVVNQSTSAAGGAAAGVARAAGGAVSGGGGGQASGGGQGVAAGLRNARNSQSASDQQIDVGKFVVKNANGDK